MPNITINHAITHTNNMIKVYSCNMKLLLLVQSSALKLLLKGSGVLRKWPSFPSDLEDQELN